MYSEITKNKQEIKYVLENLCEKTKIELLKIYGENYIQKTFSQIKNTDIFTIRLKKTSAPVGLFGLIPLSEKSAGIYLLTTDELLKGNMITFLKEAKKQINLWTQKYELIMDNCFKKNNSIKKWLSLLGFKPSYYEDENFQIYYIGNLDLY